MPESVPRQHWGAVSGVRGAATLAGTVLGFAIAGAMPDPSLTFLAAAAIMALGGLSLLGVGEGVYDGEEHAHVRDWHDFFVVFAARTLVFFGLIMLQTFVLYFFRDVQKVGDPSAGTALYAFATIAGAVASSLYLGLLSDRVPRKIVTALAGAAMAVATIGFALAPELSWILPFAVLFGIGFGGVISSGWALAMDAIPKLRDVARDLGLWGIATLLPNVVAPLVGGWLIGLFHGTRAGYQAVFGLSGFSFALASLTVLARRAPADLLALGLAAALRCGHDELRVGSPRISRARMGKDSAPARSDADRREPPARSRVDDDRHDDDGAAAARGGTRLHGELAPHVRTRLPGGTASVAARVAAARQRRAALRRARHAADRERAGLARDERAWPGRCSGATVRCSSATFSTSASRRSFPPDTKTSDVRSATLLRAIAHAS